MASRVRSAHPRTRPVAGSTMSMLVSQIPGSRRIRVAAGVRLAEPGRVPRWSVAFSQADGVLIGPGEILCECSGRQVFQRFLGLGLSRAWGCAADSGGGALPGCWESRDYGAGYGANALGTPLSPAGGLAPHGDGDRDISHLIADSGSRERVRNHFAPVQDNPIHCPSLAVITLSVNPPSLFCLALCSPLFASLGSRSFSRGLLSNRCHGELMDEKRPEE